MSEITITVSGKVGSGKSALCGEIEILCKALGVPVEWIGGQAEKNLTHADWTEALEMYKPSVTIVEQAARATPADHISQARDAWISVEDRLPEVPKGTEREFIVACRRASNGKTYVFAASYLNQMGLMTDDDDCPEDGRPTTGWFNERNDPEYDNAFQIVCGDGDEVTHWMPLPAAPK